LAVGRYASSGDRVLDHRTSSAARAKCRFWNSGLAEWGAIRLDGLGVLSRPLGEAT
jgi:hypothetical protein